MVIPEEAPRQGEAQGTIMEIVGTNGQNRSGGRGVDGGRVETSKRGAGASTQGGRGSPLGVGTRPQWHLVRRASLAYLRVLWRAGKGKCYYQAARHCSTVSLQ